MEHRFWEENLPVSCEVNHAGAHQTSARRRITRLATITSAPDSAAAAVDSRAGKYLVFDLGREEFGIQVLKVREIMGIQDITAVPHTPAHVKGVINLRGKVIPVIDLRLKFGLPAAEYTQRTCIIVVQVEGAAAPVPIGVVVDAVAEVLSLAAGDIEDTPDFGRGIVTPYLLGLAKVKGKVKILLDIGQALSHDDLRGIATLTP